MTAVMFDFQPDDGPTETIEAFDVSVDTLQAAVDRHLPDGAFYVSSRVRGEQGQPRNLLFRAARVSNVREVSS